MTYAAYYYKSYKSLQSLYPTHRNILTYGNVVGLFVTIGTLIFRFSSLDLWREAVNVEISFGTLTKGTRL